MRSGSGALFEVSDLLDEQEVRCAMIVTAPQLAESGALASFLGDLLTTGITTAVFSDVKPEADIECAEQAAALFRTHDCDAIVAIGDSAVIDCAKAAGALVARPGKSIRELSGTLRVCRQLPWFVAVPTTDRAASKDPSQAVVYDPNVHRFYVIDDAALVPDVVVIDPLVCKDYAMAIGFDAADASKARVAPGQTRIVERGPLLDERGRLAQRGYATALLLEYNRARIRTSRMRIKEWDYYLVNDGEFALALTIGDMGYAALVSASVVDFARREFTTQSTMGLLPLGRLSLPVTSSLGTTSFADSRARMRFEVAGGMRRLEVDFKDFRDGQALVAEIVLDEEPRDSMVIATPWVEDEVAFYYNQKILAMRAIGSFSIGEMRHVFSDQDSFGLLDWGRGVWTRDNIWYWSAAQGIQDGRRVGFNLGCGFGDTSAASENMFFLDGVAHKLGRVDFGIPEGKGKGSRIADRFTLMEQWHMTDDEGRLDLLFSPDVDRSDFVNLKLVISDQHQVFGTFSGTIVLDDGTPFQIRDLRGFAEAVHNVY